MFPLKFLLIFWLSASSDVWKHGISCSQAVERGNGHPSGRGTGGRGGKPTPRYFSFFWHPGWRKHKKLRSQPLLARNYWVSPRSPGGTSGIEPTRQSRKLSFDPWVGKIPWRGKWQPTPVFLPGESQGQRSLEGYSPWGHRVGHDWGTNTFFITGN